MTTAFCATDFTRSCGSASSVAQQLIPCLYDCLNDDIPAYQSWLSLFQYTAPQKVKTARLAKRYQGINSEHDPFYLIFAIQTYYALVIKLLSAQVVQPDPPDDDITSLLNSIEDNSLFRQAGVLNMIEGDTFAWYLDVVDSPMIDALRDLWHCVRAYDMTRAPADILKAVYHDLIPRRLRHHPGEYYTPDWLANHVLNRLNYQGSGSLLDPACGTGTFLVLALHRLRQHNPEATWQDHITGIDINPLAVLAARANLLFATGPPESPLTLPVHLADSILHPPDIKPVDIIAGNPPWVNFENLPGDYRQRTHHLWLKYQLFASTGMDTILGKGRKDLSMLVTCAVMDRHLREGGKLGFILPQIVLKSGSAGAGFRRFALPDTPLRVLRVDDFSRTQPFRGAMTRPMVLIIQKGGRTQYPVTCTMWRKCERGTSLHEEDSLDDIYEKTDQIACQAVPVDPDDLTSPWLSGRPAALRAIRRLPGESDYTAHASVYTGGANAVYWLKVLEHLPGDLVRVQNIIEGAKKPVAQVEAVIESRFVYPLLRGRDVQRWSAKPGVHVLVVQNPETRSGYEETWLRDHYPRTFDYLVQFKAMLLKRATYRRYFRHGEAFYSMFDVGVYTFAPVKVIWQGFGIRDMRAAVVTDVAGKPIVGNQAMHPFIGLTDEDEAHYLAACLNAPAFEFALVSTTQSGGKSFAQPGVLKHLRLPRYQPADPTHQQLMMISRRAHATTDDADLIALEDDLATVSAKLWGLTDEELADVRYSLEIWR